MQHMEMDILSKFEEKLAQQCAEMEEKLAQQCAEMEEKLAQQCADMERVMAGKLAQQRVELERLRDDVDEHDSRLLTLEQHFTESACALVVAPHLQTYKTKYS
jgi:ubiquinone biosynthesis protein UbiJ